MASDNYGDRFWRIEDHEGGFLYVMADRLEITENGALIGYGGYRKTGEPPPAEEQVLFGIGTQDWRMFFAASMLSGTACCVDSRSDDAE